VLTHEQIQDARRRAAQVLDEAGFVLTDLERDSIEVADFGLSELDHTGLEVVVYVNTQCVCAKELVMFPGQTYPEHRHPQFDGTPGKEETFRCRKGLVYLYLEGPRAERPTCRPAKADRGA
jgi:D-lyxose ketol-isomerase